MDKSAITKEITFNGDLFRVTSKIFISENGKKIRIHEKAHRPPGVRMLITKNGKILLTREFRPEIKDWDYRLPGGKVFDYFTDYESVLHDHEVMMRQVEQAVIEETRQETGLIVESKNIRLIHKSVAGSSVVWDLYFYELSDFYQSLSGQELEEDEKIDPPVWKTHDEIINMCLDNQIKEDRSVAVLLKYIINKKHDSPNNT